MYYVLKYLYFNGINHVIDLFLSLSCYLFIFTKCTYFETPRLIINMRDFFKNAFYG